MLEPTRMSQNFITNAPLGIGSVKRGNQKKIVKLHGVAMTVCGRELSMTVSLKPMPEHTERLRKFLFERFKLSMKPNPAN